MSTKVLSAADGMLQNLAQACVDRAALVPPACSRLPPSRRRARRWPDPAPGCGWRRDAFRRVHAAGTGSLVADTRAPRGRRDHRDAAGDHPSQQALGHADDRAAAPASAPAHRRRTTLPIGLSADRAFDGNASSTQQNAERRHHRRGGGGVCPTACCASPAKKPVVTRRGIHPPAMRGRTSTPPTACPQRIANARIAYSGSGTWPTPTRRAGSRASSTAPGCLSDRAISMNPAPCTRLAGLLTALCCSRPPAAARRPAPRPQRHTAGRWQVEGMRENQLIGYGLVVGLQGPGDSSQIRFRASRKPTCCASSV